MLCWVDDKRLLHWPPGEDVARLIITGKGPLVPACRGRCQRAARPYTRRDLSDLQVRWSHPTDRGTLHFAGIVEENRYGLLTKLGGQWRWYEGDRDSVLATLPEDLFEEACQHILEPRIEGEYTVAPGTGALLWNDESPRTLSSEVLGLRGGERGQCTADGELCAAIRVEGASSFGDRHEHCSVLFGPISGPLSVLPLELPESEVSFGWQIALAPSGRLMTLSHYTAPYFDGYGSAGNWGWRYIVYRLPELELLCDEWDNVDHDLVGVRMGMASDPQGRFVAFGHKTHHFSETYVMEISDPEREAVLFPEHGNSIPWCDAAFSPDGEQVAFISDEGHLLTGLISEMEVFKPSS